jgi:hypothetical protein
MNFLGYCCHNSRVLIIGGEPATTVNSMPWLFQKACETWRHNLHFRDKETEIQRGSRVNKQARNLGWLHLYVQLFPEPIHLWLEVTVSPGDCGRNWRVDWSPWVRDVLNCMLHFILPLETAEES